MSKPGEEFDNDNGRRFHLTLNKCDRDRLEMIRNVYGVSLAAAIRVSIRAASQKLGFEQERENILR